MKPLFKALAVAATVSLAATSCTTTYDTYGRPVQSVDPGVAVAGAAAAALVGYAVADNRSSRAYRAPARTYYSSSTHYYPSRGGYYSGGGYGGAAYCPPPHRGYHY